MLKTTKKPKSQFILRILKAKILPPSTHTIVFSKKRRYQKPPDDIVNYVVEQDHENQPNTTATASSQVSDDHVDSSEDSESPFGSKPASISTSLESLLRESGLSIYQQKLFDLGWDDLTFLSTRSEDELKKIATSVGMKTGHIAKFVFWISQKNR